jgi:hypothetical protein
MPLDNTAVHQDGDAAAVIRLNLDQVAGAGDAGFGTEMGDGNIAHCQTTTTCIAPLCRLQRGGGFVINWD